MLVYFSNRHSRKICIKNIFSDESNTTCEDFTRNGVAYANVMWAFPSHPSSVNLFRVILSGPTSCASITNTWFVHGKNNTGAPSECAINQKQHGNYNVCDLTCQCVEPLICGYLHFCAQFPPWVTSKVLLCHMELMTSFPGFVNPVIDP